MLDVNLLPESLVKFVKEFNLTVPTVEGMNTWWAEASMVAKYFEFPLPEMKEQFFNVYYKRMKDFIEELNGPSKAPMTLMMNSQFLFQSFLRSLLIDKIDWNSRIERDAYAQGELEALKHMSFPAMVVYVDKILAIKPVGSIDLYHQILDRHYCRPLRKWIEHILDNPGDEKSLKTLAGAIAKHRYFATCETELLKHHLHSRSITFAPDRPVLKGLDGKTLQSYIGISTVTRDFEVYKALESENVEINAPRVKRSYTIEELERILANPMDIQESYKAATYLYNSVNRFTELNGNKLKRDENAEEYAYAATPESLRDHYRPISEAVKRDLDKLYARVNERRAQVDDDECYHALSEIAANLKLTSDNFINFKSKRSWKHTDGLIRALQFSLSFILALPDREMLVCLTALKLERLHEEPNSPQRRIADAGGFAGE